MRFRFPRSLLAYLLPACAWIVAACLLAVFPFHSGAQELSKRLILKDGSYQLVTKYEVQGDRVRYMSAERNDWEELPKDLVDWPATEKFEKDRATSAIPEAVAIDKESDAERAEAESHLPVVAPGLKLPEESGVFLLDNYQGEPQLVEMQQMEGDVDRPRNNILRGALAPIASGKQSVELEGDHALVKCHVAVPSIYINAQDDPNQPPPGETASAKPSMPSLDAPRQQPQQPQHPEDTALLFDRFRIVRAKVKNGNRIISDIKRGTDGKVSQNQDFVKTTIDKISGGWLKLTPVGDLAPGEYVLVEMKGNQGMNLYVWDFSVNPSAPANANPWKPEVQQPQTPKM
jgi:hypothetical protein